MHHSGEYFVVHMKACFASVRAGPEYYVNHIYLTKSVSKGLKVQELSP